ncbi:hypothetical protein [Burkholderia sp. TSV86]|uniref:hypothetical protein n=1 Tax=Burkholderia sp. TSV86 TaxID=1385594 RepID=UPI0012E3DB1C|nr:hypothetical protein [Burkholderia sp. TSV86]
MRNANVEDVVGCGEKIFFCETKSIGLCVDKSVSIDRLKIEFLFDGADVFRQVLSWAMNFLLFNARFKKNMMVKSNRAKGVVSKMLLLRLRKTKSDADISVHPDDSQFATRAGAYSRSMLCPGC